MIEIVKCYRYVISVCLQVDFYVVCYVCRLIVTMFVMFLGYLWAHGMLTADQPQRTLLSGLLTRQKHLQLLSFSGEFKVTQSQGWIFWILFWDCTGNCPIQGRCECYVNRFCTEKIIEFLELESLQVVHVCQNLSPYANCSWSKAYLEAWLFGTVYKNCCRLKAEWLS